jgi:hypothetical protein
MNDLEREISLIDEKLKELQQSVEVKEEFHHSTRMYQNTAKQSSLYDSGLETHPCFLDKTLHLCLVQILCPMKACLVRAVTEEPDRKNLNLSQRQSNLKGIQVKMI